MLHWVLGACLAGLLVLPVGAAEPGPVDRIVVEKAQRRMDLMSGAKVVRSYEIALGFAAEGDKQQEGDGKTPKGKYVVEGCNPSSAFVPQNLLSRCLGPGGRDRAGRIAGRRHPHPRRA
jgi:L,D-transpeptidase catalytic domain